MMDHCIRCDRVIGRLELPVGIEQRFDRAGVRTSYGEVCRDCLARSPALDEPGKMDDFDQSKPKPADHRYDPRHHYSDGTLKGISGGKMNDGAR